MGNLDKLKEVGQKLKVKILKTNIESQLKKIEKINTKIEKMILRIHILYKNGKVHEDDNDIFQEYCKDIQESEEAKNLIDTNKSMDNSSLDECPSEVWSTFKEKKEEQKMHESMHESTNNGKAQQTLDSSTVKTKFEQVVQRNSEIKEEYPEAQKANPDSTGFKGRRKKAKVQFIELEKQYVANSKEILCFYQTYYLGEEQKTINKAKTQLGEIFEAIQSISNNTEAKPAEGTTLTQTQSDIEKCKEIIDKKEALLSLRELEEEYNNYFTQELSKYQSKIEQIKRRLDAVKKYRKEEHFKTQIAENRGQFILITSTLEKTIKTRINTPKETQKEIKDRVEQLKNEVQAAQENRKITQLEQKQHKKFVEKANKVLIEARSSLKETIDTALTKNEVFYNNTIQKYIKETEQNTLQILQDIQIHIQQELKQENAISYKTQLEKYSEQCTEIFNRINDQAKIQLEDRLEQTQENKEKLQNIQNEIRKRKDFADAINKILDNSFAKLTKSLEKADSTDKVKDITNDSMLQNILLSDTGSDYHVAEVRKLIENHTIWKSISDFDEKQKDAIYKKQMQDFKIKAKGVIEIAEKKLQKIKEIENAKKGTLGILQKIQQDIKRNLQNKDETPYTQQLKKYLHQCTEISNRINKTKILLEDKLKQIQEDRKNLQEIQDEIQKYVYLTIQINKILNDIFVDLEKKLKEEDSIDEVQAIINNKILAEITSDYKIRIITRLKINIENQTNSRDQDIHSLQEKQKESLYKQQIQKFEGRAKNLIEIAKIKQETLNVKKDIEQELTENETSYKEQLKGYYDQCTEILNKINTTRILLEDTLKKDKKDLKKIRSEIQKYRDLTDKIDKALSDIFAELEVELKNADSASKIKTIIDNGLLQDILLSHIDEKTAKVRKSIEVHAKLQDITGLNEEYKNFLYAKQIQKFQNTAQELIQRANGKSKQFQKGNAEQQSNNSRIINLIRRIANTISNFVRLITSCFYCSSKKEPGKYEKQHTTFTHSITYSHNIMSNEKQKNKPTNNTTPTQTTDAESKQAFKNTSKQHHRK